MKTKPKMLSMTEFAKRLAEILNVPQRTALRITSVFLAVLEASLISGEGVAFKGSFSVRPQVRKGRAYQNINQPGQQVTVPTRTKLAFKASERLLDLLPPPPGS